MQESSHPPQVSVSSQLQLAKHKKIVPAFSDIVIDLKWIKDVVTFLEIAVTREEKTKINREGGHWCFWFAFMQLTYFWASLGGQI